MEFTDYHTRLAAYVLLVDEVDGQECALLAWWNARGPDVAEITEARTYAGTPACR